MKGNIWIPGILEVFCLQTPESGILGFGIQYSAQRIPSSDWNPQSTIHVPLARNPESSSWRPQSTAWNPESKTVLDYLTRGNGSPPQLGGGGFVLPYIQGLYSFLNRVYKNKRSTQKFSGTNQKAERRRPFGTGLVGHCPQGLFSPFCTFPRAIFLRPFRLSLAPAICPWVSEDAPTPFFKGFEFLF